MQKSELLDWLQNENRQFETFLDQIDSSLLDRPGVAGEWSIKDIVAHLNGWQQHLIGRLQAAQQGEPEPPPPWPAHLQTEDEINAWIYTSNRQRSMRAVREESQQLFAQLLSVLAGLPEDTRIERAWRLVWLGDQQYPAGEFFDHYHDDHEPDLRAWLARHTGKSTAPGTAP